MDAAKLPLPPPPRLVDYVSSRETFERIKDIAELESGKPVVVIVTGCKPLEYAPHLFDDLSIREEWHLIGMTELAKLRARAVDLLKLRDDLTIVVEDMRKDLLLLQPGGIDDEEEEPRSVRVARALRLPAGVEAPPGFDLSLVGDADEGRRLLRRDIIRARLELAALAGHTERHILRRLRRELAQGATTGVVAPQELWLEIQQQKLRHPPPDSTSDAALYQEAAEDDAWAAPSDISSDSDA